MDRRDFFRALGGVVVVLTVEPADGLQQAPGTRSGSQQSPREIAAWLHIGEDSTITVFTGKVEVGQDIRTSLAQAVAEELRAPIERIQLVMGDTDRTPFDMGTFGSRTTPFMAPQLRRAAAAMREVLTDLAVERWGCSRERVVIGDGMVQGPGAGQKASFGELTQGKRILKEISDAAPLTAAERWSVLGSSRRKVGGVAFVTGRHQFPSDIRLPGMLYGKVLRPPAFGASLVSADLSEARRMPGVVVVHEGNFVGAAAPDEFTASQAVAAVRAEWKLAPQPGASELFDYLKKNPVETQGFGGAARHEAGSVEQGLAAADHQLRQVYTVAYIAHAPLEPRAAVAQWEEGKLTVWTGTQRPFGVRSELAQAFGLPESQVRVLVPDTGSGYGGKHTGDAAIEAARLARAAGRPVKVVWTREEEFTWAYFRPAGVIEITSGVRRDGTITAWEFHNYNSGPAAMRTPYAVAHQRIEFHPARSPLRQGSYRALAATANHFARETHMDELAGLVGMDPLEFRLRNTKDPRLRAVVEAAAEKFGWSRRKKSPGVGYGLAAGFEKGGYVATCAEVAVDRSTGSVRVVRVVEAFECGAVVNPDHLRNQVEGSIVMGLGGALFEVVEFDEGRILNPRFSAYRVPRFSDLPQIEVVLLDRKDLPPAGGGETPIVGIAPAVGNAIFDSTGVRLRALPLVPHGLKT
jgi:isoquinoline 1-oxidoreductase